MNPPAAHFNLGLRPRLGYDIYRSMATFDDRAKPYELTHTYTVFDPPTAAPLHTAGPDIPLRLGQVKMWKIREDLDRYRQIYAESRPEVVIETGTRWGGSAVWFRNHLQIPHVYTIDINPIPEQVLRDFPDITFFRGSSTSPEIRDAILPKVEGKRVMVVLDADHHADHVCQELALWAPLVTPGCYLVVEDAIFDLMPAESARRGGHAIPEVGGPLRAMRGFGLHEDLRWERAIRVEDMSPVSHHPCGFWKRTHVPGR